MAQDVDNALRDRVRVAARPKSAMPVGRVTGRERHALPGWYEWTVRELARYFYALLVLGLIGLVPLQMEDSWLPPDGPAVMSPAAVAALASGFALGLCVVAAFGYRYFWGEDGIVDRLVERHFDRLRARSPTKKP